MTEDNLKWTYLQLSHHILSKKSVYFVLDPRFKHIWLINYFVSFITNVFDAMDKEDYFGLRCICLKDLSIQLEKARKNKALKRQLLQSLAESVITSNIRTKRRPKQEARFEM